jgi:restriction endonuclease Mrr
MPTLKVQPFLLPVLRAIEDGAEHPVGEIRKRVAEELRLTDDELKATHAKSGQRVYVNLIAHALANFNVGKAITWRGEGVYQIADRGRAILDSGVICLTINDARHG